MKSFLHDYNILVFQSKQWLVLSYIWVLVFDNLLNIGNKYDPCTPLDRTYALGRWNSIEAPRNTRFYIYNLMRIYAIVHHKVWKVDSFDKIYKESWSDFCAIHFIENVTEYVVK